MRGFHYHQMHPRADAMMEAAIAAIVVAIQAWLSGALGVQICETSCVLTLVCSKSGTRLSGRSPVFTVTAPFVRPVVVWQDLKAECRKEGDRS
jgi:hypothetical protein